MAGTSAKEIKTRIRSMKATCQITKAMEMVASSKLRRAQTQIAGSRPYFEILRNTIDQIVDHNLDYSSPYLMERSGNRMMYIVIGADRGLAGGYNSNILKMVMSKIRDRDVTVLPIGKKALDYFQTKKIPVFSDTCAEAADVSIGDCFSIAETLSEAFLSGKFDEIHVAYTHFASVLSQIPSTIKLLPLSRKAQKKTGAIPVTLYEPDCETVFEAIVPAYLGGILFGALCESRASEQAARRTAMESATTNAEEMIADMRLKYNRTRQAAITQEITEIVAGS